MNKNSEIDFKNLEKKGYKFNSIMYLDGNNNFS